LETVIGSSPVSPHLDHPFDLELKVAGLCNIVVIDRKDLRALYQALVFSLPSLTSPIVRMEFFSWILGIWQVVFPETSTRRVAFTKFGLPPAPLTPGVRIETRARLVAQRCGTYSLLSATKLSKRSKTELCRDR
jgi:hypothetical protein